MQRNLAIKNIKNFTQIYRGYHKSVQKRFLATVHDVFPHKTDFPSRHIGPRKTEVVAMLDLLGFKVSCDKDFMDCIDFYVFIFLLFFSH